MQSTILFCLALAAVCENRAAKMGDCYHAGKGEFNHSGFDNSPAYVFNGVGDFCIVAVLSRKIYEESLCSGGNRQATGLQDENLQTLILNWNISTISQLSGKTWYVKMKDKEKVQCWVFNSDNFTTYEVLPTECRNLRYYICQYRFNYDCAFHLASSRESNWTWYLFPSDYRYSKGLETRPEHGGCYYIMPAVDSGTVNLSFSTCSATCATGNGTPPTRYAVSKDAIEVLSCNTDVPCPEIWSVISSTTDSAMPMDLFIAVIVLVVAVVSLAAVVFFVCYKRKQKEKKKATFRRRINSTISFTTENQPTSTITGHNDPMDQSKTMDSLKSVRGSAKTESNLVSSRLPGKQKSNHDASAQMKKNLPKQTSSKTSKL